MSGPWTEAATEKLRTLVKRGLTNQEISRLLGISRSAVIGKRYRLGTLCGASNRGASDRSPDPDVERVRELAALGYSGARIGRLLGRSSDQIYYLCMRNKIRLGRVGCGGIVRAIKDQTKRAKRNTDGHAPTMPTGEATDLAPDPDRPRVALLDLDPHHCRWPLGDPREPGFGFCGMTAETDAKGNYKPYCAEHARVAYNG